MIMNKETLIQEAREARNDSYSPYSEFNVGAVIQCADGSRYTGANIENINYTNTTHAEENAINSLFSTGNANSPPSPSASPETLSRRAGCADNHSVNSVTTTSS